MNISKAFPQFHPILKLLYLVLITVGCIILSGVLGALMFRLLLNYPNKDFAMLLVQAVSLVGGFGVPAYWFARLEAGKNIKSYLKMNRPKPAIILLGIAVILVATPMVSGLSEWNKALFTGEIPSWMVYFREAAERTNALARNMLMTDTTIGLLLNIVVLAIIPAICEELLFRGCLQNTILSWTKKTHLSIIIVAIVFSLGHFELTEFASRFALGLCLGYIYYYTNIYVAMGMHFFNNAVAVILYHLYAIGILNTDPADMQYLDAKIWMLLSFVATFALIWFISYRSKKTEITV